MPPPEESADDLFTILFVCVVPFWSLLSQFWTGRSGREGDFASGFLGTLVGGFTGLTIGWIAGVWWWMLLVLVLPVLAVWLNRALEAHPRFGAARRKRRRKARLIASARRAGKSSVGTLSRPAARRAAALAEVGAPQVAAVRPEVGSVSCRPEVDYVRRWLELASR